MDYCELHRVEYSNSDDECPLCAREVDSVMEAASAEKSIDEVYYDRNLLAAAFVDFYVGVSGASGGWWPDGEEWAVVWCDLPTGQVGWHLPQEMVPSLLEERDPLYDGYTTTEKNERLARWVP